MEIKPVTVINTLHDYTIMGGLIYFIFYFFWLDTMIKTMYKEKFILAYDSLRINLSLSCQGIMAAKTAKSSYLNL